MTAETSLLTTVVSYLPVLVLIIAAVVAGGFLVYPGRKSPIQANAAAVLIGSFMVYMLKLNIMFTRAPYIAIFGLIAMIIGLIILNIAIMVKTSKK